MTKKCLALLLLVSSLSACATEHASVGTSATTATSVSHEARSLSLYAQARLKAGEGDLDGALALLKSALQLDPNSAPLHTMAAQIHLQQYHPEEALAECEAAIKGDPTNVQAHFLAGNI